MSSLRKSEYELKRARRAREKEEKDEYEQTMGQFANTSITEIAKMVRSDLANENFTHIETEGSETEAIGRGKKITARNSNNEEIEVVFMPNGEIMTHMESKDKARCQQLADDIHKKVLEVCRKVAEREGMVFQLKDAKKKPAFLNQPFKAPIGGAILPPKAQKFSK